MSQGFLEQAARLRADGIGWAHLPGDALAFVLAHELGGEAALVVVDEPDAADRLLTALRFFLDDPQGVELFPADDVRPYDGFSPSPDVPAQRTRVLHRLGRGDRPIVVAPVRALMQPVPDLATREAGTYRIAVGDTLDRDALIEGLTATGYLAAPVVEHPGTYAVRGDVVDVWSVAVPLPRRLDFFDDEVEEIRVLDPRTRRAVKRTRSALILPAREERLDDASIRRLQAEIGRIVAETGEGMRARRRLVQELRAGIRFSAIEDYLPALVSTVPALDALAGLPTVAVHPASLAASARDHHTTAARRYKDLDPDERPLLPPTARFVSPETVLDALADAHPVYEMAGTEQARSLGAVPVEGLTVRGADLGPTANKLKELASKDVRVGLVAPTTKRAQMVEELLGSHGVHLVGRASPYDLQPGEVGLLVGELPRGFVAKGSGWAFVPAAALFGRGGDRVARQRAHDLFDTEVRHVGELKAGDLVVHRLHGIGRYDNLVRLDVDGTAQDFVKLVYRGDDVLYVPATALNQLSSYTASSADGATKLDRLGGQTWAARKGKVRDSLLGMAQDLLETQAKRELASRAPHAEPGELYKQFVSGFPHTETPDQAQAIVDVHVDLSGDHPMDRLLCGDVGFGKTEVAMRAAMRVVEGGRQVAVLCPTTVLAFQHLMKFRDRFDDTGVRVEMLSRFSSAADEKATKAGLADGAVDIVVGTHALLGRSVRWKQLGLLVIDEEHRFGVRQKQRFTKLRSELDVLSMSATPIPRTLQLALSGARQMSVMATPPEDRLSVRTTVARFTRTRVADAIRLELDRKGQVFFVHNRIESIQAIADKLGQWVPEARIRVAHGKMSGEAVEQLLLDFMERRFDVLVSTAIVESGVDLPNVNTMLVHRADLFGLAQLYQLRGRVGRSSVRGNCVLLTPDDMTRDARRRLQVLVENTRLGSGFSVAAADLEMRGAGNFLGKKQSGNIDAVGYQVWVELLEEAVHAAAGDVARQRLEPEVEVSAPAFLPEQLLPDMNERLTWYRRFSDVQRPDELEPLLDDLEHERGPLPPEVHALAGRVAVTLVARDLGLQSVRWLKVRAVFELHPTSPLDPAMLEDLRVEHPKRVKLEGGPDGPILSVRFTPREAERPFRFLRWVLARLQDRLRTAG